MVDVCIIFMVREFTKLYTVIKNQERANAYAEIMESYPDCDEVDKNFIIIEQLRIIDRMKTTNFYNKQMAQHYRKLYLWRENCTCTRKFI